MAWETHCICSWQTRDVAHAALLILLQKWPTGAKNQKNFLLICSNCQNIWPNECQAVSWRQYFTEGKTIWRLLCSLISLHFPEMENCPCWSPGCSVAGWTMPADYSHRHHRLTLFLHMLPVECSDLSPLSLVAAISPKGLNKVSFKQRQHQLIKPQYLSMCFANAFEGEK